MPRLKRRPRHLTDIISHKRAMAIDRSEPQLCPDAPRTPRRFRSLHDIVFSVTGFFVNLEFIQNVIVDKMNDSDSPDPSGQDLDDLRTCDMQIYKNKTPHPARGADLLTIRVFSSLTSPALDYIEDVLITHDFEKTKTIRMENRSLPDHVITYWTE